MTKLQNLLKGLIKENPVLVLVLGTCPTLAISTSVTAAFGMGIAATVVLILSNMAISALRKIIPDTVRIPCYITVIAGFVTIVELVMEAYTYELYQSLGVYLALIVVNCIILGEQARRGRLRDRRPRHGPWLYAGAVRDGDDSRNSGCRHVLWHAHPMV